MNQLQLTHIMICPVIVIFILFFSSAENIYSQNSKVSKNYKELIIEDFDDGSVQLGSYPGEDINPSNWELNSNITYNNSAFSLRLYGNTWKTQDILPQSIDSGTVWQVSTYIETKAEIQGFGITDGVNELFYSFAGSQELQIGEWIPVYQGCFPEDQWNNYQLPIGDDWLALYDYLPEITSLIYINDKDGTSQGNVYFDNISDISQDLPLSPVVSINYSTGKIYSGNKGNRFIDVQFFSDIVDPDSYEHDLLWNFGDGSTSTEQDPVHTFLAEDDHSYTVLLRAVDPTDRWGQASCNIEVDQGISSFPISLNFVGDIMLARKYEYPGGIIPTQGVESIFEPTLNYLRDSADITIANLECPLTTHWEHHPTKTIYFKGSPQNVDGLTYAGIDIVTLANNHILDYMLPGMQETQSVLDNHNILHSGAGADSYEAYLPVFYSKSGVNFAFLAASDRTGQYNNYQPYLNAGYNKPGFANLDDYYLTKQINEVAGISDLVVMEWHCGIEYSTDPFKGIENDLFFNEIKIEDEEYSPTLVPDERDREIRRYAVDQGADLVICHHPHITQGVELYKGKLIAHSLGNYIFDLDYPETYPSMILNTKVNQTGFYEFTLIPVYIDDYIPQRASGDLGLHILDDLANRSKDLDTYLHVNRDDIRAKVITDTLNMLIFETEYTAHLAFEQSNGFWISDPHPLERAGSISSVDQIQPAGNYEFRLGREKIWFGNMEDEGCTLWYLNNVNEVYCDTVARFGTRSLQHKRDENSPYNLVTNLEEKIICRSESLKYSLNGYIKTQNAKDVTIEVQYFDSRNGIYPLAQENIGVAISGNTDWIFYHKELTLPPGTKFFDIRLNSHIPVSGTAYSWFDNVSLISWDSWGEFEIEQKIPAPNDYYFMQIRSSQNTEETDIIYSETVFEENLIVTDDERETTITKDLIDQNYPNPFDPANGPTNIRFSSEISTHVTITVYNIFGQLVNILTDRTYPKGTYNITWDGTNMSGQAVRSGLYFYQIETAHKIQIKKCMLVR